MNRKQTIQKKMLVVLLACLMMAAMCQIPAFAADEIMLPEFVFAAHDGITASGTESMTPKWYASSNNFVTPNSTEQTTDPSLKLDAKAANASVQMLVNYAGGDQNIFDKSAYGHVILELDIIPMIGTAEFNLQFKRWDKSTMKAAWDVKPFQFHQNNLNLNVGGVGGTTKVGRYTPGQNYHIKIDVDSFARQYTLYVTGEIDGTAETEKNAGTFDLNTNHASIGAIYFNCQSGQIVYLDNFKLYAPATKIESSVIKEGRVDAGITDIPITFDAQITTSELDKMSLTKSGVPLQKDVDYTLLFAQEQEISADAADAADKRTYVSKGVTVRLTNPVVADGLEYIIDFAGIKDFCGRTLNGDLHFMCPSEEGRLALEAAYNRFQQELAKKTPDNVLLKDIELPAAVSPGVPELEGLNATVTYEIVGTGTTTDEQAKAALLLQMVDGEQIGVVTRPYYDGSEEVTDVTLELRVSMSRIGEEPRTFVKEWIIPRRTPLSDAPIAGVAGTLFDGSPSTGWKINGTGGVVNEELEIPLPKPMVVSGCNIHTSSTSAGYAGNLKIYAYDGSIYVPFEQTPYGTSALKLVMNGEMAAADSLLVYECEVLSNSEDTLRYCCNQLVIPEGIDNIPATQSYLTLATSDIYGTRFEWESSNSNVIDTYGRVYHQAASTEVTLTAYPLDEDGNRTAVSKSFTATVMPASGGNTGRPAGGGSGGGGGKVNSVNVPMPITPVLPTPQPGEDTKPSDERFHDMATVPWAVEAVDALAEKGIINGRGDNRFHPEDTVTREEFVKMLVGALGIEPEVSSAVEFSDVDTAAWYAPYIQKAVEAGIINGVAASRFGTGQAVTRQDIAAMIARALKWKDLSLAPVMEAPEFSDISSARSDAAEAIQMMGAAGVMSGYEDGSVQPEGSATRAETAKMLYQVMNQLKLLA